MAIYMAGRSKKASTRPHTAGVSRLPKKEVIIPSNDGEGLKVAIVWVHSHSPTLHRLAKVVLREVCSYLSEGVTIVFCAYLRTLHVYSLGQQEGHEIYLKTKYDQYYQETHVAVDNKRIVSCGGTCNSHTVTAGRVVTIDIAHMWHIDGNGQELGRMFTSRYRHGIAFYREKVLVFGGSYRTSGKTLSLRKCEELPVKSRNWKQLPQMHIARSWCSTTRLGDRLYIYGGNHALKIEVYALLARTFRVTELCLPSNEECSGYMRDGKIVILQSTHQITISAEGGSDTMEITEGEACHYDGGSGVYWRGKVYYTGGRNLYWINPENPSEFTNIATLYVPPEPHERSF